MTAQPELPLAHAEPDLSRYRCGPCGSKRLEYLHRGAARCLDCRRALTIPTGIAA